MLLQKELEKREENVFVSSAQSKAKILDKSSLVVGQWWWLSW